MTCCIVLERAEIVRPMPTHDNRNNKIIIYKSIITKLAVSDEENVAIHFSIRNTDSSKNVEIGDGIYVWTNTSTQNKISVLNKVFKLYNIDPSDLVFYLRDENKDD